MKFVSRLRMLATLAIAGLVGIAAPVVAQQGAQGPRIRVDLELLLAVDISQSMDYEEHEIQRQGYVDAFRHKDVINAMLSGPEGKIAVLYMEWAGDFDPIRDDSVDGHRLGECMPPRSLLTRLENEPIYGEQRTSISRALADGARSYIQKNSISSQPAGDRRVRRWRQQCRPTGGAGKRDEVVKGGDRDQRPADHAQQAERVLRHRSPRPVLQGIA